MKSMSLFTMPIAVALVLLASSMQLSAADKKDPLHVNDPVLRSLLDSHITAIGGWSNWDAVSSMRLRGQIEREGQTIDCVFVKKRPNLIRATLTLPIAGKKNQSLQMIRAHNGKHAWSTTRMSGAQEALNHKILNGSEANALLGDAGVEPLLIQFWKSEAKLTLCASELVGGQHCFVIKASATKLDGDYLFYLSTKNLRLLRREHVHPKEGRTVTDYNDYQTIEGVSIARRQTIDSSQTGHTIVTIQGIDLGIGIYADYFNQ